MRVPIHAAADALKVPRPIIHRESHRLSLEPAKDIHAIDAILASDELLDQVLNPPSRMEARLLALSIPQPKVLARVPGMGTVWDYRMFTRPSGGRITPLVQVEHIPVIRQMAGRVDLDVLWRVLVNEGLLVHDATDGEGNVAIYANMNRLCWHARGANAVSCGVEHMHATTAEKWEPAQIRAAAWLVCRAYQHRGIPMGPAELGEGSGFVTVKRRGQASHEEVSKRARFYDRSDPGPLYPWHEVHLQAAFFDKHGRF